MSLRTPGVLLIGATLIVLALPNSVALTQRLERSKRYFYQGALVGGVLLLAIKAMLDLPSQAFLYFNF